ncbi:MAG: hypothetical protein ACI9EW_002978, partial [Cellvibrionaceae bacterium]
MKTLVKRLSLPLEHLFVSIGFCPYTSTYNL